MDLGRVQDLKDILSFAVSFTSLVLAIFAIGQAAFSSDSTSETLGVLNITAKNLEQVAGQISSASGGLTNVTEKILDLSERIEGSATELRSYSKSYSAQVELTDVGQVSRAVVEKQQWNLVYAKATYANVLAFYILFEAARTKKSFRLEECSEKSDTQFRYYIGGCFAAWRALSIIDFHLQDYRYEIDNINGVEKFKKEVMLEISKSKSKLIEAYRPKIDKFFSDSETGDEESSSTDLI